jgi:hypothetical protein
MATTEVLGMRGVVCIVLAALAGCESCTESSGLTKAVALITPSSDTLDFGDVAVGTQRQKTLTLRSSGTASVAVQDIHVEGGAGLDVRPDVNLPTTVASGAALAVKVTFAPSSEGAVSATLVVSNNSANSPDLRIALDANATPPLDCEDHNSCTDEYLDALSGRCVYTPHAGSCDDGSACTINDFCVATNCVGAARVCVDTDVCTRDLCDPLQGCAFIRDGAMCEDNNPCTADTCDPVAGCAHHNAVDGTPCGAIQGCTAGTCVSGQCTNVPVPDGTPCFDGDLCTGPDFCNGGTCSGPRVIHDPAVATELPTFGGPGTQTALLDDGMVMVSPRSYPWSYGNGADAVEVGGVDAAWVVMRNGHLEAVARMDFPEGTEARVVRAGPASVVAWWRLPAPQSGTTRLVWLDVASSALTVRGQADVPTTINELSVGVYQHVAYVADNSLQVVVVDFATPGNAQVQPPLVLSGVMSLAVDEARSRLLTMNDRLSSWDLANPLAPVLAAQQPPAITGYSFAAGDQLAVVRDACCTDQNLSIYRLDTFALLYTGAFNSAQYGGLVTSGSRVYVGMASEGSTPDFTVKVLDFSGNAASPLIGSVPRTSAWRNDLAPAFTARGNLLVASSSWASAEVLELEPAASADLVRRRWTGVGHGALQWLRQVGPRVVAWSSTAVHTLDAQFLTSPAWLEGGAFSHQVDALVLGPGGLPVVGASPGQGSQLMQASATGAVRVMDAASPAAPQLAGSVVFEGVRPGGFSSDGRYALMTETSEINPRLYVMDLAQRDGSFDQHLQPVASVGLNTSCVSDALMFSAFDPLQLVGLGVACTPTPGLPFLILVDARDPLHPFVRATGQQVVPSADVAAVAVSDTRVLTLEGRRDYGPVEAYSARKLRVYDVAAGAITEASSLDIPLGNYQRGANHFLGFDGNTAFISEAAGLLVVDVSVAPPVIRARLPMKEPPLAAVFAAGRIYATSQHRVSVVEPPCAPPLP